MRTTNVPKTQKRFSHCCFRSGLSRAPPPKPPPQEKQEDKPPPVNKKTKASPAGLPKQHETKTRGRGCCLDLQGLDTARTGFTPIAIRKKKTRTHTHTSGYGKKTGNWVLLGPPLYVGYTDKHTNTNREQTHRHEQKQRQRQRHSHTHTH